MNPPVLVSDRYSDNLGGADNQQERLTNSGQNPQRLHAGHLHSADEDIVPSARRLAGMVSKLSACNSFKVNLGKKSSEIPCRVSSDLHEWRNDGHTVSTRDSVKLKLL